MKKIIIYNSKSGFSKRYAYLIKEELKCKLISLKNIKDVDISDYEIIIYGGGIYASKISGLNKIIKLLEDTQKIIIFGVGLSKFSDKLKMEIEKNNFDNLKNYKFFYFRGGFDYKRLNFLNKIIIWGFKKILESKKEKDKKEKIFLESIKNGSDYVDKKKITPLIEYIN
ncbi:MAG: flavodoxin domain-containing protein [Bacillota bacterium]